MSIEQLKAYSDIAGYNLPHELAAEKWLTGAPEHVVLNDEIPSSVAQLCMTKKPLSVDEISQLCKEIEQKWS
jgi:hypothetical protein